MPATDDSSDIVSSSSPIFSLALSTDSVTSSEESSMDNKYGNSEMDKDATCTPSRVRRYPAHLSHGSPPRKPQSNQYETMEELLAAAGYTATRVFTPETERTQKMQEQAKDEHKDAGLGSMFAGWIAHILPVTAPSSSSTSPTSPKPRVEEDVGSNPFLSADADAQFPQTTRSLRTHLMSRALRSHPQTQDAQRTITTPRTQPVLRHVTSAPSLPRAASGRRRELPTSWRNQFAHKPSEVVQSSKPGWSGGFVPKQTEVRLNSRTKGWFATAAADSTVRVRSGSQPPRGSHTLRPPTIHRTRSAPRPSKIQVPAPAPPVRPSPVVQPNVVVCRSVSSLGSSSSVQTRSSAKSKSKSKLSLESDDDEPISPCPVLTPESAHPDGLPTTPVRPVLVKQRSARFLKRSNPPPRSVEEDEPEPDLASIIHAFRPPSAPPSPARRQQSIRSLRALLKDPKFPNVPVVCVASPGTVSAGGPGRAVWLRDPGWDNTVTVRK
ncbi:hypothetical protein RSOLAG1IB_05333 [Rhizoctonia solani AG-1 IB]|uniref:Uncharacterized protein n=1 Tax=Thanatephorus cucumeris (strain AG1-IB / isolate 7/3/14) TaxID=1108050 RepID=A0A0B7G010_THACB|nr:hypothetical protein RSOLAG1IB_05333 [Rhizoctonia solani AG-1 IB]